MVAFVFSAKKKKEKKDKDICFLWLDYILNFDI